MSVLQQTRLVYMRSLRPPLRNPVSVIIGIAMPLLYLVLFGPLLTGLDDSGSDSWQWFVPGLLVQLTLFGTAYAGFSLLPELRSGVMERLRVTPISRSALLLGRVFKDVSLLILQSAILTALALLFGFHTSVLGAVLAILLVGLTGIAVGIASYTLALKLKQEFAFAPVLSATVVPLMLLSGVLLPMDRAPDWLYTISRINPLSHVVDATRAVIRGDYGSSSVPIGLTVAVGLVLVSTAWGVFSFGRDQA